MTAPANNIVPDTQCLDFGVVVTPGDTSAADIKASRRLWVGGAGTLTVIMAGEQGGASTVLLSGIAAGTLLPIRVTRVMATGTTATLIVALY